MSALPVSREANSIAPNTDFFCSWSGGKDACLALYKMQLLGHQPKGLLTMLDETGQHSLAHHLPKTLIEQQANALGLQSFTQAKHKNDYQGAYLKALTHYQKQGLNHLVLGDIDLQAHRDWQETQGQLANITPLFPLWLQDHKQLVLEFIEAGFTAVIISVLPNKLSSDFLGRELDLNTIKELEKLGVDVCAEGGEFHTFVTNGPIFSKAIELDVSKAKLRTDGDHGYHYLDFS
jgi:uncharacterized protein (TIGR00290 family)